VVARMRTRPRTLLRASIPLRRVPMLAWLTCLGWRTQPTLRTRLPIPVGQTLQPILPATPAFQLPAQTSTGRASAERSATAVATPSTVEKPAHERDGCAGTTSAPGRRLFVRASVVCIRLMNLSTAATLATAAVAPFLVRLPVRRPAGSARTTSVSAGRRCARHGLVRMAFLTIAATSATGAAARFIARPPARRMDGFATTTSASVPRTCAPS